MSKPREFWVIANDMLSIFVKEPHQKHKDILGDELFKVIEKSAADKLAEAFSKLLEASNEVDGQTQFLFYSCVCAREALKDYRGEALDPKQIVNIKMT